jgi:hypothetical protein
MQYLQWDSIFNKCKSNLIRSEKYQIVSSENTHTLAVCSSSSYSLEVHFIRSSTSAEPVFFRMALCHSSSKKMVRYKFPTVYHAVFVLAVPSLYATRWVLCLCRMEAYTSCNAVLRSAPLLCTTRESTWIKSSRTGTRLHKVSSLWQTMSWHCFYQQTLLFIIQVYWLNAIHLISKWNLTNCFNSCPLQWPLV